MPHKTSRYLSAIMVAISAILSVGLQPVHAQTASAMDVIQAVNELRASYGLEPYDVSNKWMKVAQQQSDYQASIGELTHQRPDGSGPGDQGISSENIGGGFAMSAEVLISQWTDYWHAFTMLGFTGGLVGAGVALSNNGYYYYTLVVKNTGKLTGLPTDDISIGEAEQQDQAGTPIQGSTATQSAYTPLTIHTSTPQTDGSVKHIVSSGETLWSIAELYEVTVAELAALNYLDPADPLIYPGQTLIIHLGFTATPTPTITNTPLPPTRTLQPSRTMRPSSTSASITPYGTGTKVPLVPSGAVNQANLDKLGIVTLIMACIGGAAVIFGKWYKQGRR